VSERGIYFVSRNMASREYAVQLLDPVTGKSTVLWKISQLYLNQGLGVSPDGKTILISAATQSGADLMLVDGFR
jgi:hypothetical protein